MWGTVAALAGGSLLSSAGSYLGAKEAGDAARDVSAQSVASAREQMAFQERMSSTAHQREVADLKAAGLNPLLSANAGSSSPAGALPSLVPEPSVSDKAIGSGLSTASELVRLRGDMKEQKARTRAAEEQAHNTREGTERTFEDRRGIRLENDLLEKRNAFFEKNPWAFKLNAASGGLNSASGILRLLK